MTRTRMATPPKYDFQPAFYARVVYAGPAVYFNPPVISPVIVYLTRLIAQAFTHNGVTCISTLGTLSYPFVAVIETILASSA